MPPAAQAVAAPPARRTARFVEPFEVKVSAVIDGTDELWFHPLNCEWSHLDASYPANVEINGVKWNPQTDRGLHNRGQTRYAPVGALFVNAELTQHKGRTIVGLKSNSRQEYALRFHDPEIGGDLYEVTLKFYPQGKPGSPAAPTTPASR